jgi:methionyl-tRNA synthetase
MVVNYSFEANKYFNDSEPWALKKKDPERMKVILFVISQQIKNISILLNPIIPISSKKVLNTMNVDDKQIKIENIFSLDIFNHDKEISNLEILFTKIQNDN